MYDHEVRQLLIEQLQAVPQAHAARNARLLGILGKNHDKMLEEGESGLLLQVYRRLLVLLLTNNPDPTLTERLKDAFVLATVDINEIKGAQAKPNDSTGAARLLQIEPVKVVHEPSPAPTRALAPRYQFTAPAATDELATTERTISFAVQPGEYPDDVVSLADVERLFYDELTHGLKLRSWVAVRSSLPGLEPTLFVTARFGNPKHQ